MRTESRTLICMFLLALQSCALITSSIASFSLERQQDFTFQERACFTDGDGHTLFFFEDGSCLLVLVQPSLVDDVIRQNNNRIYGKFSSEFLEWGIYQLRQDSIQIEFQEVVRQGGFVGVTRWNTVLQEKGDVLQVLPGPVNRKVKTVSYQTIPYSGVVLKKTKELDDIDIDPEKAWVNR